MIGQENSIRTERCLSFSFGSPVIVFAAISSVFAFASASWPRMVALDLVERLLTKGGRGLQSPCPILFVLGRWKVGRRGM